jgi:hypothetical protein
MEPYIIEVKIEDLNELLFVYATEEVNESGSYLYIVYQAGYKLGSIYANVDDNMNVNWYTSDLIAQEIVNNIGKQIECKDM